MTVYTLQNLVKTYATRNVLDIDSLDIEANRIYALLGPNGAGKTTLLNILAFLEKPTQGRMQFRSKPVQFTDLSMQKLRKKVVVVEQHPILFTTTVFKNVEFGLKVRNIPRKRRSRIVEDVLELVGMRSFSQAQAHRLSGGETQRVALARALAVAPKVFLCDEPTASVDIENQGAILGILRQINAEKKITIIFTTHDRSQTASLAHHTLMLNQGRLVPTTYENLFQAELQNAPNGGMECVIQSQLTVSLSAQSAGNRIGRVRLYIDPEKIELAVRKNGQSHRNAITGRVVSAAEENGRVRLQVDAGMIIHVLMRGDDYAKIRLAAGDLVQVRIHSEAIHFY